MTFPPLRPTENRKGIDKSQKLRLGFFPNFCYSYRIFFIRNETDHVAIFKKNYLSDKVYINWIHYSLSEGTLVKRQKGWRSKGTYRKLHCWYARPSLLILIFDLFFVFILINRSDWIWSRQCTDVMIYFFVCFFFYWIVFQVRWTNLLIQRCFKDSIFFCGKKRLFVMRFLNDKWLLSLTLILFHFLSLLQK